MTTVNVGGSWVPSVPPVKLSRLTGAVKQKKFSSITPGTHTLLILADISLRSQSRFAKFDPNRKVAISMVLLDKHQQKIGEDSMVADASSPFVSYAFKLSPDQCPAELKVRVEGENLNWLRSTKVFMRVVDGDLIRSESDMTSAARRLAKDFPYLSWEVSDIVESLSRQSEQRDAAAHANLERPFLLLASSHPAIRKQIANTLGIKTISSDSHKAAHQLLMTRWTGLKAHAEGIVEKVFGSHSDWTLILRRALIEFQPVLRRFFSPEALSARFRKGSFAGATTLRQTHRLEKEFMLRQSDFVQAALKASGDEKNILGRARALTSNPPALLEGMFESLDKALSGGDQPPTFPRWKQEDLNAIHGLVVSVALTTTCKPNSSPGITIRSENPDNHEGGVEYTLSQTEEDAATVVDTIHAQVLWGSCKPSRQTEATKSSKQMSKLVGLGQRTFLKKAVLAPLAPWLMKPLFFYQLAENYAGMKPDILFAVVSQLLIHRIFLGMMGINVPE